MIAVDPDTAISIVNKQRSAIDGVLPVEYSFESLNEKLSSRMSTLFIDASGGTMMVLEALDKETILIDLICSTSAYQLNKQRLTLGLLVASVGALYVKCKPATQAHARLYRMHGFSNIDEHGYSMITVAQLIGKLH